MKLQYNMSENGAQSYNMVDHNSLLWSFQSTQQVTDGCESSTSGGTEFVLLMQYLGGHPFPNTEEVEVAVREWLWMREPDLYSDGIFKLAPRLKNASVCGILC
jgi:hypothetical protein